MRHLGALALTITLVACGGPQGQSSNTTGDEESGVVFGAAGGPETPPAIALQLYAGEDPGPALDLQGRLLAPGGVLGQFEREEDGTIRFRGADGRVRAWLAPDGAIHTPLSTLDARVDGNAQLVFGDEAIFIDDDGMVVGSVTREGLRFVGVNLENRREAIFLLVIAISIATPAG